MKHCLHCRRRHATAPRGLCERCWRDGSIRYGYPVLKSARTDRHGPCRHCGVRKGNRAKRLCNPCSVRHGHEYQSESPLGNRGSALDVVDCGREPVPTTARPGTAEKVTEMQRRAARGEKLFARGDATFEGAGGYVPVADEEAA